MHRQPPGVDRIMEYECRVNLLVPEFKSTFVCVYDIANLSGATVADLMATHPYVILRGEIRRNAFYVPPKKYLELLAARRAES